MLYKKYHKNYVRQFKKGAKVMIGGCLKYIVDFIPSIMMLRLSPDPTLHSTVIMAGLSRLPVCDECCCSKVLISSNGKLNSLCHVI